LRQVDLLKILEHARLGVGAYLDRDDRLARRASMKQLCEAPPRRHPVGTEERHDGLTDLQPIVKGLLPVGPRVDAGLGVEIEKHGVAARLER
jgi:hypothetical protein